LSAADNLAPGRTEDDLLVELLLKRGIDLAEPSQTREIAERTVHAFGGGVMLACLGGVRVADAEALADGIADWVEALSPVAPAMIFFKDAGFENDVAKTNVAKILDQRLSGRWPSTRYATCLRVRRSTAPNSPCRASAPTPPRRSWVWMTTAWGSATA
jgi:adenine-specific DNA-methyltransferase